ncbi:MULTISPECIES: FtsX-like permease family protein [unclassified Leifsonia]|uniref:FtsX-like permease family protein n=1 Tax=unclassified Leifsonia TaxID=2663824 RepID=UPI0012FB0EED|nr:MULTISPECIES: FtsX-like permease family protein [unclassified Leifsonia]
MRSIRLAMLRARARAGLLLGLGAVVAVAALAGVGIIGGLATATATGVHDALVVTGPATELVVTADPSDPDDAPASRDAVDALIDETIRHGDVQRSVDDVDRLVWTITPADAALTPAGAAELRLEIGDLVTMVDAASIPATTVATSGGLTATLAELDRGVVAVSSVLPVPLLLIFVFAWFALAQLARLLRSARSEESELLTARGMTAWQLGSLAILESAVTVIPAAVIGAAAAVGALSVIQPAATTSLSGWPFAVAVGLLAMIVAGWSAGRSGIGGTAGRRAERSGRGVGAATATGAVLATIAAAVAVAQLLQYGSPLVPSADGGVRVDPIAELAPVLMLVAGALLALLLLRPAVIAVERAAARGTGLAGSLAARQVARRFPMFQVAVLLVCLAVGSAVFASGYSATWRSLASASAQQATGTSVRIALADDSTAVTTTAAVRAVDGVTDAAPVATAPIRVGDDPSTLTALSPALVSAVLADVGGTVDTAAMAAALAEEVRPGIALAENSTSLRIDLDIAAPEESRRGEVAISAWLADTDGALVSVGLGSIDVDAPGRISVSGELPVVDGGWSLLAVDGRLSAADGAEDIDLELTSVETDPAAPASLPLPEEPETTLASTEPLGRIMLTDATDQDVPAVISTALAEKRGLRVGDRFDYQFDGLLRSGSAVVAGLTPSVPGSADALAALFPLATLDDALLRDNDTTAVADEVWAAAADPALAAAAIEPVLADPGGDSGDVVTVAGPGPATLLAEPVVTAGWVGVGAAIALAVIATVGILSALGAARSGEVALLRAIGVPSRAQGRGRAVELSVAVIAGGLAGVAVGALTVLLTAAPFAAASVAESSLVTDLPPSLGVPALAAALLALALPLAVVIAVHAHSVRRSASRPSPVGEIS